MRRRLVRCGPTQSRTRFWVAQRFSAAERPALLHEREGHGFSRGTQRHSKGTVILSEAKDLLFAHPRYSGSSLQKILDRGNQKE